MTKIERGNTKKVRVTVKDEDDSSIDPDNNKLYITVTNLQTETTYLSETEMTRNTTGTYDYYLSTSSSDSLGDYNVKYSGDYNSKGFLDNEVIQFVDRE